MTQQSHLGSRCDQPGARTSAPGLAIDHRDVAVERLNQRQAKLTMNKRQDTRLQALHGVQDFLTEHTAALPTVANCGARKKFDDIMADIKRIIADQSGAYYTGQIKTQQIHELRRALVRDHMKPIAKIAAAELPKTPALAALRLPKETPSLERLIAYARGMEKLAAAHAAIFIEEGLPADFLAQFTEAATTLGNVALERSRVKGERGGATKGLETQLGRARKLVGVIDAFVVTALQDDPARLTDWNIVKRVRRGSRPTSSATETAPQTPKS